MPARKRVCFVASSPLTVRAFLSPHIAVLSTQFDVSVAVNAAAETFAARALGARVFTVPVERRISVLHDLWALMRLTSIFWRNQFDVVHSVTPKAGLLSMAAAWLARIPVRIHTFTGQVWATRKGPARALLRVIDRLIASFATHVLVDSRSQRNFLIANRVVTASKSSVLGEGSICGVDGERFRPDAAARGRVRSALGVPENAVLFLYVGRFNRDKGVLDLASAFAALAKGDPSAHLLLVGPDEGGMRTELQRLLAAHADRVHWSDYTEQPEAHMAAADAFCLPSYREGFGQVAVEASATGLPVIASRIYGVTDAVADGETGLLHVPGDVEGLRKHMQTLLTQPDLRRSLGNAGRSRALREFSADRVTRALLDYYSAVTGKL